MTNKPTSGQLQGFFNALRATKSFASDTAINIAGGNYASGKTFAGAVDISDPAWSGATDTFYVYIDENDQLILNATAGFPTLSTKIARVEIVSGTVIDVFDERASINGLIDGYQVLYNDSNSLIAEGDTIQEALESLDAYVASISGVSGSNPAVDLTRYKDFDIFGGVKNGLVDISHVDDTPVLEFKDTNGKTGRVRFSASVPEDYVGGTDIIVKIYWSPEDTTAGDVNWQIRYRSLTSDLDNVNVVMATDTFAQAASGVANRLTDTGNNLTISSSDISPNDILIINVERVGDGADTYNSSARVHLIRLEYTGRGIE